MEKSELSEILQKEDEFEICVCGCGSPTGVRKDTPIQMRGNYVEGVGPLRDKCYQEIYGPSRTEEIRTRLELYNLGIII